jgi:hypothetical protein
MCNICALALRHQGLNKRDSLLSNTKNLSVLITLNQQTPKPDKSSASDK